MGRQRTFETRQDDDGAVTGSRCALCGRVIPEHARSSRHHLHPRLKGGAKSETVHLHHICHNAIHAHFSEAELARYLTQPEALQKTPQLAAFIAWVRKKPDDFHASTRRASSKRGRRRGRMA